MYAVVNRYRNEQGVMTVRFVYTGFPSKTKAKQWNMISFATPEMNLIVPVAHFSEMVEG